MTVHPDLDAETGLPTVVRLLAALAADPHALRAVEMIAVRTGDPVEEPFAVADDQDSGARVGQAFHRAAAVHRGSAFRLSGTVYGLLLPVETPAGAAASTVKAELAAISERLAEGVVFGRVTVPLEVSASREALRLAFRRLQTRAASHPLAAGRQVRDVLLRLLSERSAAGERVNRRDVVSHALAVGRRLGLGGDELDDMLRAAELQDVGMLALHSAVLGKISPLDAEDWAVIRHHPIVGERVLSAAPALESVGAIVRSCYERFDGTGYPDGRRGSEIPLSARIISVCVGYAAMTSWRPYRPPMPPDAALQEITRCAGSQFDPRVVAMFHDVVGGFAGRTASKVA